jgi:HEAT repeat protein
MITCISRLIRCLGLALFLSLWSVTGLGQPTGTSTWTRQEIEKQQQRLRSTDDEERRDALLRLRALRLPEASRIAMPALTDASPMIRAVAAGSILALGPEESVPALLTLLNDKEEFVRREVTYALGLTKSRNATAALCERLLNDKEDSVRGAAAVALGQIADEAGVVALVSVLAPELSAPQKKKKKVEKNEFILRAVAEALGKIKSRAGTAALIATLDNEKSPDDVRRESARALGSIGDPAAIPALKSASSAADPYLAQLANQSLRKLTP